MAMQNAYDLSTTETQLIVMQPTPFCNINCRYCYLPDRLASKRMRQETVAKIFEAVFALPTLSEQVTILWHAGEPLTMPLDFYRQAAAALRKCNTRGVDVIQSIQTNGMLITQEWCDFILEQGIHIGVSMDGPQQIHDQHRVDRAGRGTFARALAGFRLLQSNNIHPYILMVLTQDSISHPDQIWQFLVEQQVQRVGFNTENVVNAHTRSSLENDEDIEKYRRFLTRILELRSESGKDIYIAEIDTFLSWATSITQPLRAHNNVPLAVLSFDSDGNVSTFSPQLLTVDDSPYGHFRFGNVHEQTLMEIFASQRFAEINTFVQEGVEACRKSCDYFLFCGGGSPAHKLGEHAELRTTETKYCKMNIQVATDIALDHLEARYL